jgi:predicted amidophosphoribosyltransferase
MHTGSGPPIVHALKYGGWHAVARDMAERMARLAWPADVIAERAAVLPVPLAPSRLRERGFNQSERLARALAESWRVPLRCDVLDRARATDTQTRLTPEERLANVSGAFRVRDLPPLASRREHEELGLRGAHVVLVDDVVTTAATLNACAEALVAAGARCVSYVTFGRAPAAGDR